MKKIICSVMIVCFVGSFSNGADLSFDELMNRARKFESLQLIPIAREQYKWIIKKFPKQSEAQKRLQDLSHLEANNYLTSAQKAHNLDALQFALVQVQKGLSIDPQNEELKKVQQQWVKELNLRDGLKSNVSKDFKEGLSLYQQQQWEKSLDYFVRVLNMDPANKDARLYVDLIGKKLGMLQ